MMFSATKYYKIGELAYQAEGIGLHVFPKPKHLQISGRVLVLRGCPMLYIHTLVNRVLYYSCGSNAEYC